MLPPHETFPYHCLSLGTLTFVVSGEGAEHLAGLAARSFSPVVARYAYPRFETRAPFFPVMAADDLGKLYQGLDALDWMAGSGLLYPRSDAMGVWVDGSEDQLFLKELDLAVPPLAFAAASAGEADFPGSLLSAAIQIVSQSDHAITPGGDFPSRLSACLPTFQLHADLIGLMAFDLIPHVLTHPRPISFEDLDDFLSGMAG
ncbi:MAG: hypothetical protein HYZ49_11885 [Chloroflexi bacterium]|nr:hypothetical protein [Chloroflexota bacterium]